MMKLTIFVCLALAGICAANTIPSQATDLDELIKFAELYELYEEDAVPAGLWDSLKTKGQELKDEIKNVLQKAIDSVQQSISDAVNAVPKLIDELKEKANQITKQLHNDVDEALQQLDAKIEELTGRAEGVDVTECTQMAAQLHDTALLIFEDATSCVGEKIEEGTKHVEKTINMAETFIQELVSIQKAGSQCSENAGDDISIKIIGCLGRALKDATYAVYSRAPAVMKHVAEITWFVQKAIPSLAHCSATKTITTFWEQTESIVPRVEACIDQKVREAEQSASPKYY